MRLLRLLKAVWTGLTPSAPGGCCRTQNGLPGQKAFRLMAVSFLVLSFIKANSTGLAHFIRRTQMDYLAKKLLKIEKLFAVWTGLNPFSPYDLDWLQSQESPLMINPELDKLPERHFSFNRNGKIVGRTAEGVETINICMLNRKGLIRERLKIREDYVNSIKSALADYGTHNSNDLLEGELSGTFKLMKKNCHQDEGHSLYHIFIYKYFDYFIDTKLPTNLRGVATKYFYKFRS